MTLITSLLWKDAFKVGNWFTSMEFSLQKCAFTYKVGFLSYKREIRNSIFPLSLNYPFFIAFRNRYLYAIPRTVYLTNFVPNCYSKPHQWQQY